MENGTGSGTSYIVRLWKRVKAFAGQKFTVMLIPHTEHKVFNFQISLMVLVLSGIFVLSLMGGVIWYSVEYSGNIRNLAFQNRRLEQTEASLEILRTEVDELGRTTEDFQGVLDKTLSRLGIRAGEKGSGSQDSGDLSSFFSLREVDHDSSYEARSLQQVRTMLEEAIDPVNAVGELVSAQEELLADIPSLWPIKGVKGRITNNFGPAENPFTGQWYLHRGLDIASYGYGIPIVATANGKAVNVDFDPSGYGNYVTMRHKYGFYTLYGHMQRVYVRKGQEIQRGDVIGIMGSTGLSTGPHLHFEVRVGSEVVDPAKYLSIYNDVYGKAARY